MKSKITYLDFLAICGEKLIDPNIAAETPEIIQAVKNGKTAQEISDLFDKLF